MQRWWSFGSKLGAWRLLSWKGSPSNPLLDRQGSCCYKKNECDASWSQARQHNGSLPRSLRRFLHQKHGHKTRISKKRDFKPYKRNLQNCRSRLRSQAWRTLPCLDFVRHTPLDGSWDPARKWLQPQSRHLVTRVFVLWDANRFLAFHWQRYAKSWREHQTWNLLVPQNP